MADENYGNFISWSKYTCTLIQTKYKIWSQINIIQSGLQLVDFHLKRQTLFSQFASIMSQRIPKALNQVIVMPPSSYMIVHVFKTKSIFSSFHISDSITELMQIHAALGTQYISK